MKRIALALFLLFVPLPALAETWDSEAVQALPYLYHEEDLRAELKALNQLFTRAYANQLKDYYMAEMEKEPAVITSKIQPITYDCLSPDYQQLLPLFQRGFAQNVADAQLDFLANTLEVERQAYRAQLTSADMVALKNFYLDHRDFFYLPLTYANMSRFYQPIQPEPKTDLVERQAVAGPLASRFRLNETDYSLAGDEVHNIPADFVERNLTVYLANAFSLENLQAMDAFAASDTGLRYLHLQDLLFKNRFMGMQYLYQTALARAVDQLRANMNAQPPLVLTFPKNFERSQEQKKQ
jgi:hypothetical protein